MKAHAALLSLAIWSVLPGAQAGATITVSASARAYQPGAERLKPTPRGLDDARLSAARHLFPVRDEMGLLLLS